MCPPADIELERGISENEFAQVIASLSQGVGFNCCNENGKILVTNGTYGCTVELEQTMISVNRGHFLGKSIIKDIKTIWWLKSVLNHNCHVRRCIAEELDKMNIKYQFC
jgi:hypothetical protein